jgi:hypothetical protein
MSAERFAPLWLEINGPGASTHLRHRLHGDTFTIGRGYANDLVLDDPYVSPSHVRIARDDSGQWWIEDLQSDNGTRDLSVDAPIVRMPLVDNAAFLVGQTTLNIRSGEFAVAPTLKLNALAGTRTPDVRSFAAPAGEWRLASHAAVALGVVITMAALSIWFKQTGEPKFTNYIYGAIFLPMLALVWAGGWALVTRIVAARAQFFRHLRIAAVALIAFSLLESAFKYIDYAFAWVSASSWEGIIGWLILGALGVAHVRVIVPKRTGLVVGIVATLALAAVALDQAMKSDRNKYQPPTIITSLLPPAFPTKPPRTREALFEDILKLKSELDEERKKDPPQGFNIGADMD